MYEINISKLTWHRDSVPAPDGRSENQMHVSPMANAQATIALENGNRLEIVISRIPSRLRDNHGFSDREQYPSLKSCEFFTVSKYAHLISEDNKLIDEFAKVPFDEILMVWETTFLVGENTRDELKYACNIEIGTVYEEAVFLWK